MTDQPTQPPALGDPGIALPEWLATLVGHVVIEREALRRLVAGQEEQLSSLLDKVARFESVVDPGPVDP